MNLTEREEIELLMRSRSSEYWCGPAAQRYQARYRELVSAEAKPVDTGYLSDVQKAQFDAITNLMRDDRKAYDNNPKIQQAYRRLCSAVDIKEHLASREKAAD